MKILMMTNSYFPFVGGIEKSLYSFSQEFRKMGHEVMIAAPAWEGRAVDEEHVIRLPAIKKFYHTEFSVNVPVPGLIPWLVKTFPADIIHSHHPFFLGDVALRMSRQYRIPLVFTYHIMFEKYVHYLPVKNEKAQRFVTELAAGYCNLVHRVISPSQSVRGVLLSRGVTVPVDVVSSGVDLHRFSYGNKSVFRLENDIPQEAMLLGYVGRLAPEKNLECLVRCLIGFLRRNPQVHVVFIGNGSSETMIKEMFNHAGLMANLHMTGILQDQPLVDAYYAMDAFVFTSLSETQGMVLLEAMAAGVPVIAMDSSGVRDVVKNFHNGRLIASGNEVGFMDALSWFKCSSLEEKELMRQRAKETAQQFSKEICARLLMDIYQQVLALDFDHDEEALNAWARLRERMRAEWDLFKNLLEASDAAMHRELTNQ